MRLSVRELEVSYATEAGVVHAVSGVSFDVPAGSTVALVGESGCGKTSVGQALLRLLPSPPARVAGRVELDGQSLLDLPERAMREVRGGRIGMVFQEPLTSLNPVYTAGFQVTEAVRLHGKVSRAEARQRMLAGLARVGLPRPAELAACYPHELSGGMRQRVLIAMALAASPALLIADEPTSALDSTVQAQVLELLADLRRDSGMSLLLIAHDLALVAEVADTIVVLYAGVVVESGPARAVLQAPGHPYTQALLRSLPPATFRSRRARKRPLPTLDGALPDLRALPSGCRFHERCPEVMDRCRRETPPLVPVSSLTGLSHVRCFLAEWNPARQGVGQGFGGPPEVETGGAPTAPRPAATTPPEPS